MMHIFQKFQGSLSEDAKKRSYYGAYTVLFSVTAFFIFSWCIFSGRSLIIQGDGWNQHIRALIYYGQYLRQVVRSLLTDHQLIIPDWDFCIGEGSDVLAALHYYVVGDPIALLSVFVPTRFMHYFYSFSCVLRLYLAGIAFSALAFGTGCRNRYGIMAGALSYCFCFWEVFHAGYQIIFLNPFIYFPLVILGIEKIIHRERPYLFIVSVAVSAVCNFYFFYIIVLLTIIYTLVRLGLRYGKDLKNGISVLLQIGAMSVIGVCLAGIVFLPVLAIFLQDSRLATASQTFHLFYPLLYYGQLPAIAIANECSHELYMGFASPVILSLFLLFCKKKKERLLKILFGVCLLILLFPIFGRLLNGMSYASNRWSVAFVLLCSYVLTKEWDDLICPSRSDCKKMQIGCFAFLLYIPCLIFAPSRTIVPYLLAVVFLFLSLLLVRNPGLVGNNTWKRQPLLLLVVCLCAINLGCGTFSPIGLNHTAGLIANSDVLEKLDDNETGIIKELSDASYSRYSGPAVTENANITNRISNTQYFWSASNPYTNRFRSDLEMIEPSYYCFQGYDDRTSLLSLSAVQYYVTNREDAPGMPYGYTPISLENNRYFVYKNENALPLGYCYDSYVTQEIWESLDVVQKQELQLEAAYVEESVDGVSQYTGQISDYSVPYQLKCSGNEITEVESGGFITTAAGTTAVLSFEGRENSEIYLCLEGLEFMETPEYDLYLDDETVDPLNLYSRTDWEQFSLGQQVRIGTAKMLMDSLLISTSLRIESSSNVIKSLIYSRPEATYSSGRHDYVINLGYTEEPVTSITITFSKRGVYTVKNLSVYCVPMEDYAEKIGALAKNTLQNIQLGTNEIRGELTVNTPQLLCMAIPYSAGWKALVDGVETPVMVANERYLGISVPAGSHTIKFHYSTPYKYYGLALSLAGLAAFAAIAVVTEKRRRSGEISE